MVPGTAVDMRVEQEGPIKIARIRGDVGGENVEAFSESLHELVTGTGGGAIIDLTEVKSINSAGLAALIHLVTRSRLSGGQVFLVNPTPFVREILEITRLNRLFDVCPNLEDARQRLRQP